MSRMRACLIWGSLGVAAGVPVALSLTSPLLAWREPVYILAGLAGCVALAILLVQPLLITGRLPGLAHIAGARAHRWLGTALVLAVVVHVGALWITSPPDVVDVLLFASPAPFSIWGALAMWAVLGAALVAVLRGRIRPALWRRLHTGLVAVVVGSSLLHAVLIEGTMERTSKIALCFLVLVATGYGFTIRRVWRLWLRRRPGLISDPGSGPKSRS